MRYVGALCLFGILCGLLSGRVVGVSTLTIRGELPYEALLTATSVRVLNSPGGTGAAAMALAKVPQLIIDGSCRSACAWGALWNKQACITPRSQLVFHAPHDPGTGAPMPAVEAMWIDTLPAHLKAPVKAAFSRGHTLTVYGKDLGRAC